MVIRFAISLHADTKIVASFIDDVCAWSTHEFNKEQLTCLKTHNPDEQVQLLPVCLQKFWQPHDQKCKNNTNACCLVDLVDVIWSTLVIKERT